MDLELYFQKIIPSFENSEDPDQLSWVLMMPADQDSHYFSSTQWICIINEIAPLDWPEIRCSYRVNIL